MHISNVCYTEFHLFKAVDILPAEDLEFVLKVEKNDVSGNRTQDSCLYYKRADHHARQLMVNGG